MMWRVLAVILFFSCSDLWATSKGTADEVTKRVTAYFTNYSFTTITSDDPIKVTSVYTDNSRRRIRIQTNAAFAAQPFTKETVNQIYKEIARSLPSPYNSFSISVQAGGAPLEELVPRAWNDRSQSQRYWGTTEHKGNPWVSRTSNKFTAPSGLQDRHLCLWASHGKYFDLSAGYWKWQRPRLFCTTEDLFTQSFVIPFLIPMLENAGAIVFTPRERDWQRHETVVDNNDIKPHGVYTETEGSHEWKEAREGFAGNKDVYRDRENPFTQGTYRYAETETKKGDASTVVWQPNIPEDGDYAVYVSYASLPNSVSDANYTVRHRGVETTFKVNQQMGGGTWVYLGTFNFKAGVTEDNCVLLSNLSNYRGVVTADAVRFGGGMGNVARAGNSYASVRSNLPRSLEGSRYTAQWSGMGYDIYGNKEGTNDYAEDINTRSLMADYMARGSVFLPGDSGQNVPIELSVAVHSDAGQRPDNSIVGTLGIYTTGNYTPGNYEGPLAKGLFPSGMSRMTSRDLCDEVMTSVCTDMSKLCGTWTRRQMYDKNYSETRLPEVPSMILETLSHQNWADMRYGHDPWFKFLFSRAVYKGILRFVTHMHGENGYVVQPMPVTSFAAVLDREGNNVTLSWSPVNDPWEPTANPDYYIVYTATGEQGFDNGTKVFATSLSLPVERGKLMRFRITAANDGGQSLQSEELCVYSAPKRGKRILMVNGFHRLSGPQLVNTDSSLGFDMNADPGVVFQHSPCYCGKQTAFDRQLLGTLGESGAEYEGILVAGNTFDYPTLHATDLIESFDDLSLSSCSSDALSSGQLSTTNIDLIDYILGAQRNDGYSLTSSAALPESTCKALRSFTEGGGALLMSGAYLTEELNTPQLRKFATDVLHLNAAGIYTICDTTETAQGMGTSLTVRHEPNEKTFAVKRCSILEPNEQSFCTMLYAGTGQSAAVACQTSEGRTLTFGFPLETIENEETRKAILSASIRFLLP